MNKPTKSRIIASFLAPIFIGILNVYVIVFARGNVLLVMISILLIPFLVAWFLTRGIVGALVLTWINEMFFGGSGDWVAVGAIGGRWFLFIFVMVAYLIVSLYHAQKTEKILSLRVNKVSMFVVFYGIIFPMWLVFYSVVFKGTPLLYTLKDVRFLFVLLIYFPLRSLVAKRGDVLFSYLVGACFGLSLLLLLVSIGPVGYRESIWRVLASQPDMAMGMTESGFSRSGFLSNALLNIIVFFGLWLAIKRSAAIYHRITGWIMVGFGLAPILFTFLRGAILGFLFITLLVIVGMMMSSYYRRVALRLLLALVLVGVSGITLMSRFVPDGLRERFNIESGLGGWVGDIRLEQIRRSWEVLMEEPWLGKGVGVALSDINTRSNDPNFLPMEAQYSMLLYRFGLLAFGIFFFPIAWLFYYLIHVLRKRGTVLQTKENGMMLSFLLSTLVILLMGVVNPYLTTPYTGFLIAGFLTFRRIVDKSICENKEIIDVQQKFAR